MTDKTLKRINKIILTIAFIFTISIGCFMIAYGYDSIIWLVMMLGLSAFIGSAINVFFNCTHKVDQCRRIAWISSCIMALVSFVIEFTLIWHISSEMFTKHYDFAYPTLTGITCGLITLTIQLWTIKHPRYNKELGFCEIIHDNISLNKLSIKKVEKISDEFMNMRHEQHILFKNAEYFDYDKDPANSYKEDICNHNVDKYIIYYDDVVVGYILAYVTNDELYVKECYISESVTPYYAEMYLAITQLFDLYPKKKINVTLPQNYDYIRKVIEIIILGYRDECYYDVQEDGMHIIAEAF